MSDTTPTPPRRRTIRKAPAATVPGTPAATTAEAAEEPRNMVIECLQNRTPIGKALCAAGRVDFPVTLTQARALQAAGLARIVGTI